MIQNNLPHNAKAWVYQSTRSFTLPETVAIKRQINQFVEQWTSHKVDVVGWGDLLYERFVILMADDDQVKLGGCSIDSSVRFIKNLEDTYQTRFFDRWNLAYKQGNEVLSTNRENFAQLLENGHIKDDTIVFNNLVQTKAELLDKWQIPYKDSWLKRIAVANTSFNSIL